MVMTRIVIDNLTQLSRAAREFIDATSAHKIFAFYGSMGAGKTTFIKAICKELGTIDSVTSPTFTLVNEYSTGSGDSVFHFDFYRIDKIEEVFDFGFEEYMISGKTCFMEWPEKIEAVLPDETVKVIITVGANMERIIDIVL
jgi:tRNA threonylcarbamoyladenosine biosynthesis protein TsaE